ncbi:TetR/AcrR family transcriptional regulator [Nocardiopsis changdeensis]|uniref:TetR/AcrR family transcriptional regulator n=1 Tax=Nocardiopsis changdeensis TaxID=2831969 RepID=A0ABX8BJE6_9ACTN|nr:MULTISPECIES: TetR/AcrR family transcriptional regulator [Nocardiopsis]QUX21172.1 TetR/AcrR family transcriptional regulator [Nocardiopsis changdeensis]QYX37102.1 TetR/AcrR family transcriptional regulator [Nocardiopsis sp. MT53]
MGRPRGFDEEQVVRAARDVFWEKGFDGTSTADLCAATGLNRSSLYNTFRSKEHLFLRALARYTTDTTDGQVELLDDDGLSGLDRIRALLARIVDDAVRIREEGPGSGCFVVNTTTSFAAHDPAVARLLGTDRDRRLASLRTAVLAGRADGSVHPDREPEATAWYLVSVISGIRVAGQSGARREVLESVAGTAVEALRA